MFPVPRILPRTGQTLTSVSAEEEGVNTPFQTSPDAYAEQALLDKMWLEIAKEVLAAPSTRNLVPSWRTKSSWSIPGKEVAVGRLFLLDFRAHVGFNRKLSGRFRAEAGSALSPSAASPSLGSKGRNMISDLLPEPGWVCYRVAEWRDQRKSVTRNQNGLRDHLVGAEFQRTVFTLHRPLPLRF